MIWDALLQTLSTLTVREVAIALAVVSVMLLAVEERRLALLPLLVQYLLLGSLVAAAVFSYIMLVRIAVGMAIFLMLYISAGHVEHALAKRSTREVRRPLGISSDIGTLFRLATLVVGGLAAYGLWRSYPLPDLPSELGLASYWLMVIGLLMAVTSSDPLRVGYGVLTLLNGFWCFYIFPGTQPIRHRPGQFCGYHRGAGGSRWRRGLAARAGEGKDRAMILSLIALPIGVALVLVILRRFRVLASLLAAGALIVLVATLLAERTVDSWLLFGRAMDLPALESAVLAWCFALLALTMLYTNRVPQGDLTYPVTLSVVALFIAATAFRNSALATLLLEAGIIVATLLVPSERPGAAMSGMRVLVLLALSGPLLLVAAWAMQSYGAQPNAARWAQMATVALALGFGIGLGVFPWHIWQPALYQHGRVLAVVVLNVVLPAILLLHLGNMLQTSTWPGERTVTLGLLLYGGLLTAVAGSVMTLFQRSVGRVLAFVALADLGLVLVGLGLGTEASSRAALLHMGYRGVAVSAAMMGVGVLQQMLGGDTLDHLRSAFRRAPLAMLGVMVGGLSLAGLPLTAGFTTRLSLYGQLAADQPLWGLALIASSIGPIWAVARFSLAAWVSTPVSEEHEPVVPGIIIALLSLVLLVLGLWPNLLTTWAGAWLQSTLSGSIWR